MVLRELREPHAVSLRVQVAATRRYADTAALRPDDRRRLRSGGRLSGRHADAVGPRLRVTHVRAVRVPDGRGADTASVPELGLREVQ